MYCISYSCVDSLYSVGKCTWIGGNSHIFSRDLDACLVSVAGSTDLASRRDLDGASPHSSRLFGNRLGGTDLDLGGPEGSLPLIGLLAARSPLLLLPHKRPAEAGGAGSFAGGVLLVRSDPERDLPSCAVALESRW